MQLTNIERMALRRAVRNHQDVLTHVSKPGEVNALSKDRLISIAHALKIDVSAAVANTDSRAKGYEGDDGHDLWRYSRDHPGFVGRFEFELVFELFSERVVRQARIDYAHTPDWEYYDLNRREPMLGWDSSSFAMEVLVQPSEDRHEESSTGKFRRTKPKPAWVKIDILGIGVLPNKLVDDIYARIDDLARVEDANRRAQASSNSV